MEIDLQKASEEEVFAVFALYEKRIAWMEEKGIAQWNRTGYLSVYPLAYFQKRQREGSLFVCRGEGGVRAAAVLLEQDDRWPEDGTAALEQALRDATSANADMEIMDTQFMGRRIK